MVRKKYFDIVKVSLTGRIVLIALLASGAGTCLFGCLHYMLVSDTLRAEALKHIEASVRLYAVELEDDLDTLVKDTASAAWMLSEFSDNASALSFPYDNGGRLRKALEHLIWSNSNYISLHCVRQGKKGLETLYVISRDKNVEVSEQFLKMSAGFIYSNMASVHDGEVVVGSIGLREIKGVTMPVTEAMTSLRAGSMEKIFVGITMGIDCSTIPVCSISGDSMQFIVSDGRDVRLMTWSGAPIQTPGQADGNSRKIEAFLRDGDREGITFYFPEQVVSFRKVYSGTGNKNLMVVGARSSLRILQKKLGDLRLKEVLYIVFTLCMVCVTVFVATRFSLRPVKKLTEAARRISEGDESVTIEAGGSDEIARLAEAIKIMLQHMIRTRSQYHFLVESLDDQVKARTRELEAMNLALEKEIEEKRNAERSLFLAGKIVENTREAVMITDANGIILEVNKAFSRITGYSPYEVIGRKPDILKSGKQNREFYTRLWKKLRSTGHWQGEMWNRRKNGELYPVWNSISVVYGDEGMISNFVSIHSDITVLKETERRLEQLAHYDPLTGLPNRTLLQDRLKQLILLSERNNKKTAVIVLDLDGFKEINDTMGHDKGDEILIQVAARLKECVRKSDTVARLGGDEFVVVLPNINSFDNLIWVAQNIIDAMNDPFYLEDKKFLVTASLGIALYPDDGKSGQTVMKNADAAMYASKESGKNTFRFFKESMLDKSIYKLFRASEIREAIERGEFILHFQPRFWTGTRKIHSAEALVRWEHPERGLIYPGDFIPLAEETGLITRIDRWVLQEACSKNRELQEATGRSLVFSINLSAKDFAQHNLIDIINRCIMDSGIAPALLEVEITETVIMEDVQRSIKTLERLKETGVTISVDDFGTGYSSLSYLKMFPIDLLKIDRSFVTGLPDDRNDMAVVEAIIAMGHALGMSVLAEGVETSEQFDFLARKGCDFMQGYYFARPVPFDVLEKMLLAEYSA